MTVRLNFPVQRCFRRPPFRPMSLQQTLAAQRTGPQRRVACPLQPPSRPLRQAQAALPCQERAPS